MRDIYQENLTLTLTNNIVDLVEYWGNIWVRDFPSAEDAFSYYIIRNTRYRRYLNLNGYGLIVPYLFFHKNNTEEVFRILRELSKLFFMYSVSYGRALSEINSLINGIIQNFKTLSCDEIIEKIVTQKNKFKEQWGEWMKTEECLSGPIATWHPIYKTLICRITEYFRIKPKTPKKVFDLLFNIKYDIEHIHANGDKTKKFPEVLQNSIGNLTMLEYDINRSIGDKDFSEKKKSYKESVFPTIQDLVNLKDWTVEDAEKRREEVVNNIYNYLFS